MVLRRRLTSRHGPVTATMSPAAHRGDLNGLMRPAKGPATFLDAGQTLPFLAVLRALHNDATKKSPILILAVVMRPTAKTVYYRP